uniref:Uncharacterized protein n=1 Tax=Anopheles atroparvus TaxID=41427 RepID=A0A182J2A3_ANOAO
MWVEGGGFPSQLSGVAPLVANKAIGPPGRPGTHADFELTPIVSIGIFIGILTVIICIIIAIAAAFKLRSTQAKQLTSTGGKASGLGKRPGNLPIKEKISLPLSQSEDMYDEKNPDVVPSNEDPDYKLISANQTPTALHNSLCNSKHDIIGRTILDDSRKTYLTGSANEVHYAELALAIPHDDNSSKNHLNNHLNKLPPPPAYNYFDEPTIYAQIDHGGSFKPSAGGATAPGGPSAAVGSFPLISPVSQHSHAPHHHPSQPPLTLALQSDGTATPPPPPPLSHHHPQHQHHHVQPPPPAQHTPHSPTTASLLQLTQPLPQHPLPQQHSPLAPLQLPSPSLQSASNGGGKQYLREIVTVRTPLAFSQQESCV